MVELAGAVEAAVEVVGTLIEFERLVGVVETVVEAAGTLTVITVFVGWGIPVVLVK